MSSARVTCPCGKGAVSGDRDQIVVLATGDYRDPPYGAHVICRHCGRQLRLIEGRPVFIAIGRA
jgi:hypothetical protein